MDNIKLAKARFVFQNDIFDIVEDLIDCCQKSKMQNNEVYVKANMAIERWEKSLDKWDGDFWDAFINEKQFNSIIDGLNEPHVGDCIGLPCTCNRCFAESLFDVESSVFWKTKEEGYKLFSQKKPNKE